MQSLCGLVRHSCKLKSLTLWDVYINQCRSTYILRRKFSPILSKEDATRFRRLRPRHFIYELVEDTNQSEPPDLHVVLTTFVDGVGYTGDVISVAANYARDHLLLPGKAVYATPENIEYYGKMKKDRPEEAKYSSINAGMNIRLMQSMVFPVQLHPEDPWIIEPRHIQCAFIKEGMFIPEEAIKLPDSTISGPDPSKEGKDFAVLLTLNEKETFPVRCRLFHYQLGLENVKLPDECYVGKRSPVLSEQEDLLNSMAVPVVDDGSGESHVSLKEKYRIKLLK